MVDRIGTVANLYPADTRNGQNSERRGAYDNLIKSADRPEFRQTGEGLISGSGWDSYSRITAAGMMQPKTAKADAPKFYQSGKGVISAKPIETQEEKTEIDLVPIEKSDMISGVVAAGISLNSLRPLQPFPSVWDVFSSPVALIDGGLEAFRLPDPSQTINAYMSGIDDAEYDDECLLADASPTRQRLPNAGQHNSYAIEARAIMRGQSQDMNAFAILNSAAASSYVDMVAIEWAGPYSGDEARIGTISIAAHVINSHTVHHTDADPDFPPRVSISAVDPDIVAAGSTAIFDLLFYSVDGANWRLIVTRIR